MIDPLCSFPFCLSYTCASETEQQRIDPFPGGRSLNRPGCLLGSAVSLMAADTDPFPRNSLICPHRCCAASHSPLGPAQYRVQCQPPQCTKRRMVAQTLSLSPTTKAPLLLLPPSCPALPISAHLAGRVLCPQGLSISIWAPSLLQREVGEEGSEPDWDGSPEGLSRVVHLVSKMPSCLAHYVGQEAAIGSLQPGVLMGPWWRLLLHSSWRDSVQMTGEGVGPTLWK